MVERLGEMRKGRRERIKKGSREGIEREVKRQFEVQKRGNVTFSLLLKLMRLLS